MAPRTGLALYAPTGAAARRARARPMTAMAMAARINRAATANVVRMPAATASGRAAVISVLADAVANTAPIRDAPVISPRLRDRLSKPEMTPR